MTMKEKATIKVAMEKLERAEEESKKYWDLMVSLYKEASNGGNDIHNLPVMFTCCMMYPEYQGRAMAYYSGIFEADGTKRAMRTMSEALAGIKF